MKKVLVLLSISALGMALAVPAFSQSFTPTRPVELVVHTGPGGGSDVLARAKNTGTDSDFRHSRISP